MFLPDLFGGRFWYYILLGGAVAFGCSNERLGQGLAAVMQAAERATDITWSVECVRRGTVTTVRSGPLTLGQLSTMPVATLGFNVSCIQPLSGR